MNRLTNLSFNDVQEVLTMARNENTMPGLFHWLKELNRKDEEIVDILVKPIPANSKIFDASLIFSDETTAQRQFSKKELTGNEQAMSDDVLRKAIQDSLHYNSQAVVRALIQEEVAKIATQFGLSQSVAEKACQTLCSRRAAPSNETLSALRGDSELQREFFTIIQEQQTNE